MRTNLGLKSYFEMQIADFLLDLGQGVCGWFLGLDETNNWVLVWSLYDIPTGRSGHFSVSRWCWRVHFGTLVVNFYILANFSPDLMCVPILLSFWACLRGQIWVRSGRSRIKNNKLSNYNRVLALYCKCLVYYLLLWNVVQARVSHMTTAV